MDQIIFDNADINYEVIGKKLKQGALVIYPTDTVYGVGGSLDIDSVKKIYEAKERSFKSPLIALVSRREKVYDIALVSENKKDQVEKLIEKFWPGGLTIILKKKECIPSEMVSGGETVGVRMPDHKTALEIIESAGGIIPTTSANISGEKTPRDYSEISEEFKKRVEIIVDGGKTTVGIESTIIDMSKDIPVILRSGAVSKDEIESVIGKF